MKLEKNIFYLTHPKFLKKKKMFMDSFQQFSELKKVFRRILEPYS